MLDLRVNPFFLNDEAEKWVNDTLELMTDEEKIGQLFVLESISGDPKDMDFFFDEIQPGGFMHRPNTGEAVQHTSEYLQAKVKIPLLVAGNLCGGVSDVIVGGQDYASCMQIGATNDPEYAYRQGVICGESAKVMGINWTYAPVSDLNLNYMNSITLTRAYGDRTVEVGKMVASYIKGAQEHNLATTFKHFPGDGVDFRDQHVTISVNSLGCDEWDESFGSVFKEAIEAGALTCMSGHITLPSYSMKLNPELTYGECLPGSLSKELLTGLLREKLGFNGMIVTDAAQMAGMSAQLTREEAVPLAIEAGNDMFLFYRDFHEDLDYMRKGLETGKLSRKRLDEAVTRILATKAALGLHKGVPAFKPLSELNNPKYADWAKEAADKSITLAKNLRDDLFPVTPDRYKKILLYSHTTKIVDAPVMRPEMEKIVMGDQERMFKYFVKKLQDEGFDVEIYSEDLGAKNKINAYYSKAEVQKYDLAIHFANVLTEHGRASRILYKGHCANNAADTDMYIPTILISLASPYLLVDAPRVKTCINCYTPSTVVVDSLVEKLASGKFEGVSPVEHFCGLEDTKY